MSHSVRSPQVSTAEFDRPLAGCSFLVTRAASQASQFCQQLTDLGAWVLEMPTLEIVPPSSWEPLDRALGEIHQFDWLILTSANAVDSVAQRCQEHHITPEKMQSLKIGVVGQKTADRLADLAWPVTFMPDEYVADALVQQFPDPLAGCRLLFPRVETGGRDVLVKAFQTAGAIVEEVPAYESACPRHVPTPVLTAIQTQQIQWVTFASSKTVVHFCQLLHTSLGQHWLTYLDSVKIASIGPQTSKTCQSQLGRVDVEANPYTLDGLITALVHHQSQPHSC